MDEWYSVVRRRVGVVYGLDLTSEMSTKVWLDRRCYIAP